MSADSFQMTGPVEVSISSKGMAHLLPLTCTHVATGIAWPSDKGKKFQNPTGAKQGTGESVRASHTLIIVTLSHWIVSQLCDAYDSIDQGLRILPPALFPEFLEDERFIVWMRVAGYVILLSPVCRPSPPVSALHLFLRRCTNARSLPTFRKLWGIIDTDLVAGAYTIAVTNSTLSSRIPPRLALPFVLYPLRGLQTSPCRASTARSTWSSPPALGPAVRCVSRPARP